MLPRIRDNLDTYVQNKPWQWYVPFWFFAAYIFIKLFDFELGEPAPSFFILIAQSLNFFLHEIAHLITAFLPHIFVALAGSLAEILLGLTLIITAFAVRSYYASVFCFLWFMLAMFSVADYIGDARSQSLPLVSFGGGDPIHDWNFILTQLNLLTHDTLIANLTRGIGIFAGAFGLVFSGWLLIRMIHAKSESKRQAEIKETMNKIAAKTPAERDNKPFMNGSLYPDATKGRLADKSDPPIDQDES